MATYEVKDKIDGKTFVVAAPSDTAAIVRTARDRFEVRTIKNAADSARLVAGGAIWLDDEGDDAPDEIPADAGDAKAEDANQDGVTA